MNSHSEGSVVGARARIVRTACVAASAIVLASGATLVSGSSATIAPPTRVPHEFQFTRLAYADNTALGFGFGGRRGSWTTDAPEAEYHFLQGLRRLSRVNADEESTYVEPMDPKIFDQPFLYAVEVGRWHLTDEEAAQLRDYLLRGGFLMVDDFHGTVQWEGFMESMRRVFPDRPVVEIPDDHEVFHVAYDLGGPVVSYDTELRLRADQGRESIFRLPPGHRKIQIPGIWAVFNGTTYEQDGTVPHWRGVFDDDGRLMVAINFNMDMGDAWEHADDPRYPQPLTALAYRFAVNYVLYAMTH
jgi:hypothetical protein